jgi:drug/metabolite transporter (DMT)-like permease
VASAQDFSFLSVLAVIGTVGFVGRDLATRATAMTVTMEALGFYGFLTMLLAGASFAVWDAQAFVMLTPHHLLNLGAALTAGVLAYIALVTAMRTGSLAAVTPFRYTRLLFGVSLGVLVFGERPDLPMLLGCAIVIGAGLYIGWQGKARQAA